MVISFSHSVGEASKDFLNAFGLTYLTEQHCNKVIPVAESFKIASRAASNNQTIELSTTEKSNQLTENRLAQSTIILSSLLSFSAYSWLVYGAITGGHFKSIFAESFFTQELYLP